VARFYYGEVVTKEKDVKSGKEKAALNDKIDGLTQGNQELQSKLDPFISLAKEKYPNAKLDAALDNLQADMKVVVKQAARLEEEAAPRTLTKGQRDSIVKHLRRYAYKGENLVLAWPAADKEAAVYAAGFREVLHAAGVERLGETPDTIFPNAPYGVQIRAATELDIRTGIVLQDALEEAGIRTNYSVGPSPRETYLIIGHKAK